jgi:MFS family permease
VIGILAIGWLSDRWGRRPTVTLSYLSSITGIAALLLVAVWPSMIPVYAFVVFFGLMQGARGPILVALVARIFAGGSIGTIFGALSMALGTGAAVGSFTAGLIHQWTGNYVGAFVLAICSCCVGMASFWLAPSIRQEKVVGRLHT